MLISGFKDNINKETTIKGWIFNIRSSGKIAFLQVRDGSGFTQAIIERSFVGDDIWNQAQKLTIESSVKLTGKVTQHPKQLGVFELQVGDLKIVQIAPEYPIGKKDHGPDFLLDQRHLWIRSQKQWAVLHIRSAIYQYMETWLGDNGFMRFDSPIITPSACEGTTELFEMDYFDLGKAYLTQSGQLYLEAGIASFGRVYDFGPVFRAEKSKTRRHLTEFWMMDAEAAFVDHEENIKIQEEMISELVNQVVKKYSYELGILERDLEPLKKVQVPFERMTHAEAVAKLKKLGSNISDRDDLGAEDERLLASEYNKPIFIEKYPAEVKAFYMKRDPTDASLALCNDLLAPDGYGEIIGGSQREDDYDELLKRIKEHKLDPKDFEWYLDLRKYGSIPHSGFGVGLERLVAWICGLKHVRETIPFPRMITRKSP